MWGNNTKQNRKTVNGNNRKITTIEKWQLLPENLKKKKKKFNILKEKMCKTRITKLQARPTEATDVQFTL